MEVAHPGRDPSDRPGLDRTDRREVVGEVLQDPLSDLLYLNLSRIRPVV